MHAQPGASRTAVAGRYEDAMKVRINAKDHGREANKELLRFLARLLQVPPSALEIVSGLHSREKVIAAHKVNPSLLQERLQHLIERESPA
ncbi:MAG: DUF167 domain-containing protein [Candidatus Binatia bacterium]|nr:DUF167 domain-containing protein [Candidatus Binatia bacterium]